ncbi:S4 domain-containing protein [Tepidamorphus sp. 3E244]|uniref:S4 domain-containing protein n=1 Tax=Tepidamorphus sp. 3E244 TaxID=3385498 RepID=UPI0038FCD739
MTQHPLAPPVPTQRADLWLWHARLAPTRTRAANLIREGAVRINKVRVRRPSATVKPGDVITLAAARHIRVIRIEAIAGARQGATKAALLFSEIATTRMPQPVGADAAQDT